MIKAKRKSNQWIFVAFICGLSARLALLWTDHQAVVAANPDESVSSVPFSHVILIDDPDALVVIGPGPDGLPGRAGVDDGGNGTTDEKTELGATGSDDVCRVVFGAEATRLLGASDAGADTENSVSSSSPFLIVQRGAFRPVVKTGNTESTGTTEVVPVKTKRRELVRWTDEAGQSRELLRDL